MSTELIVKIILAVCGVVSGIAAAVKAYYEWKPKPEPRPEKQPSPRRSTGDSNFWWGVAVVLGVLYLASPSPPPYYPQPYPPMGMFCGDQFGNRGCQLPRPMPIGSPCSCITPTGHVVPGVVVP